MIVAFIYLFSKQKQNKHLLLMIIYFQTINIEEIKEKLPLTAYVLRSGKFNQIIFGLTKVNNNLQHFDFSEKERAM